MSKVIGIDLGTTNSCVSVMEGGSPVVIINPEGGRTTASVVATKKGERLVGEVAKRQATTNPETIFSIKSKMGTSEKVTMGGKQYTPQEISAMILQTLKHQAEVYLGETVTRAVITVPAYFNDAQRQATKDAGRIAGLEVERIINEPTAAALAYGLDKVHEAQTVLVYDLGGGTFDVSILELDNGFFEVRSTAGDNKLGGDDFDEAIMKHLADEFNKEHGSDILSDRTAYNRIREAAEKAKKDLSSMLSTQISLPFLAVVDGNPLHMDYTLTRDKFEDLTCPLVERTIIPMKRAMEDAGLEPSDLTKVILVGGSTRIPAVYELVERVTGHVPHKGINPDEAVSIGAAIQGAIMTGDINDLVVVDVTPLSLGIETMGGVFTKLIDRNTAIPTSKSQVFSTAADNQSAVKVHVLQGERAMAVDNKSLGEFQLTGIEPAPRGVPQIEVTFSIDRNSIVSVTAKNKVSGKEQTVVITGSTGLTEEEISRMVIEAEENAEKDRALTEEIEVTSQATSAISQSQAKLAEALGLGISDQEQLDELRKATQTLEDLLAKKDILAIREQNALVREKLSQLMIAMYQSQEVPEEAAATEVNED